MTRNAEMFLTNHLEMNVSSVLLAEYELLYAVKDNNTQELEKVFPQTQLTHFSPVRVSSDLRIYDYMIYELL